MKRAALVIAAVAGIVLAVLVQRAERVRGSADRAGAASPAAGRPASAPGELVAAAPPGEEVRAPALGRPDDARTAPLPVVPDAPPPALPRRLAGTVVVVDEDGSEHAAEDGSFRLVLWQGADHSGVDVAIDDGRWSVMLPAVAFDSVGVQHFRLRERVASYGSGEFTERLAVPDDGWFELRVRWARPSVLSVRDRETGAELAPVLLAELTGAAHAHPGPGAHGRDVGPSPVALTDVAESGARLRTYAVRSPGYAWGRIDIDEERGGERVLALERGGDLEVVLTGAPEDGARLRLFTESAFPEYEFDVTGPVLRIDALVPGAYRLRVERVETFQGMERALVLGEDSVEIVAGGLARGTIALRAPERSAGVPLAGVLVVPAEWELGDFELGFERLDGTGDASEARGAHFTIVRSEMQPEGRPPETFHWSMPEVVPGTYEVTLDDVGFTAVLAVGASGLRDVRIVVPPPAEVRVRCTDGERELPPTGLRVDWHAALPEPVTSWSSQTATFDAALQRFVFRAPAGDVLVSAQGTGFAWKTETFAVRAGVNELTLVLKRTAGLRVLLRDGANEIPWGNDQRPRLVAAEGQRTGEATTSGGGHVTLYRDAPGRYTLIVPEIPGYEPVPEQSVQLELGEVKELVIELQRAR